MTEKSVKFWSFMLLVILGMAVLVMCIDFSIKGAILEESIRLRREIQSWKVTNGTKPEGRTDFPGPPNGSDNGSISGDVLDIKSPRMETRSSANGTARQARSQGKRRANGGAKGDDSPVQPGSE